MIFLRFSLLLALLASLNDALQLGVEWVIWPEAPCNVLPFAVSGAWTARDGSAAPTSAAGWPLVDAYAVLFDYAPAPDDAARHIPASVWGIYTVTWEGNGSVALYPGLGTVLDCTLDEATWTSTAHVLLAQNSSNLPGLVVGVFDSVARPGAPVNSGFANLRVLQPGCAEGSAAPFFTPGAIAAVAPFAHARVHEWLGTNQVLVTYPQTIAWEERRELRDVFWAAGSGAKPKAVGAPWESALLLAQQAATQQGANLSLWVNIPVYASDDFVAQLAQLLRHGNASLGVAGLGALPSPYLYIEHGNELWLNQSNSPPNYAYNRNASIAEVARGGSVLNADGCTDPEAWARRRHAKRLREIALQFQAAFEGSSIELRPVLAWMQDYSQDAAGMLEWLEATYGAGEAARAFWGYAVNSYRGAGVYPTGTPPLPPFSTPLDVLSVSLSASQASLGARLASAALARRFGLHLASYEGSAWSEPDGNAGFNGAGFNATLESIVAFNRMEGAAQQQAYDLEVTWRAEGLSLEAYNFYALSGPYGPDYAVCFGLCEDISNPQQSAKYVGALALLEKEAARKR